MELTTEEIAKVFAMYMPCAIEINREAWNSSKIKGKLIGIEIKYDKVFYSCQYNGNDQVHHSEGIVKLLLTPLSKITDEHAEMVRVSFLKLDCDKSDVWPLLVHIFEMPERIRHNNLLNQFYLRELLNLERQLILWGYDMKLYFGIDHWANGKTAIELGIAIESAV